jgi:hypothetical protein
MVPVSPKSAQSQQNLVSELVDSILVLVASVIVHPHPTQYIREGKLVQVVLWKLLQFRSFFVEICTKNSPSYIAFSRNFCPEKFYSSTTFFFSTIFFSLAQFLHYIS